MEPTNTAPNPTSTPPVAPAAAPAPAAPTTPSGTVVSSPKSSGRSGSKKQLIMVLLLVVIVLILGALGYYYYAFMMNKPAEEMSVAPTVAPQVTTAPASDQIQNEEELDEVVKDLDNATDEASMSQEANNLQSDSNF